TPRLRLRRLKSLDLEDLRQLLEDEDSLCALNWEKVDATQIEAWLEVEKQRRFPHDAAYGYLGIETFEKPRLIGLACIRFQVTDSGLARKHKWCVITEEVEPINYWAMGEDRSQLRKVILTRFERRTYSPQSTSGTRVCPALGAAED